MTTTVRTVGIVTAAAAALCAWTAIGAGTTPEAKERRLEPGFAESATDGLRVITENYAFLFTSEAIVEKFSNGEWPEGQWTGQIYIEVEDGLVLIEILDEDSDEGEWIQFRVILLEDVGNKQFFLNGLDPRDGDAGDNRAADPARPNTRDCPGGYCSCSGNGCETTVACCPKKKSPQCSCTRGNCVGACLDSVPAEPA